MQFVFSEVRFQQCFHQVELGLIWKEKGVKAKQKAKAKQRVKQRAKQRAKQKDPDLQLHSGI